jgi:DNA-binding transcriptional ArsR family regulator
MVQHSRRSTRSASAFLRTREHSINRVLAAISDPTRRAILERLARGPARISDIAGPFPMSLTGFCKHVRILERARLVRRTRHGRGNTLQISPEPLRAVAHWVLNYEHFWNERLDRLESFFAKQKEKEEPR